MATSSRLVHVYCMKFVRGADSFTGKGPVKAELYSFIPGRLSGHSRKSDVTMGRRSRHLVVLRFIVQFLEFMFSMNFEP